MINKVLVSSSEKRFQSLEEGVEKTLQKALNFLQVESDALEVFLVGDREIKRLNGKYRRRPTATNVLSFEPNKFPYPDFEPSHKYIGEIILAPDYVKKRGENLGFLAIHALLHLMGYSHTGKSDRMKMEKLEKEIYEFRHHKS